MSACDNVLSKPKARDDMKNVILILKNEAPSVIDVQEGITSLRWTLSDGTETELEVLTAIVPSLTGDSLGVTVATNIDDLSPMQIRDAFRFLSPSN